MSMSQEEIEALMSGIEVEDTPNPEENSKEIEIVDEKNEIDEISELINSEITEVSSADAFNMDETSEIMHENENTQVNQSKDGDTGPDKSVNNSNNNESSEEELSIDELVNSIASEDSSAQNMEIDSINDTNMNQILPEPVVEQISSNHEEIGKGWAESKIDQGVFPFPVDKDTQVVNQLSQVASDSEEKASKILDTLSLVLDNNDFVTKEIKPLDEFVISQIALLETLNEKFPNIAQFKDNLTQAKSLENNCKNVLQNCDDENMEIYGAMELMQFNDINRQKIERVMSVIRKLSTYLNNLFEDDNSHKEIVVAKHITGDTQTDLVGADDLESLIEEYSKG
ncbi:MAG: hypothetical protein HRT41_01225 [Campylobacteraceae bacterium]|nr:hypothetical protein [Campylobacteraceae bacterium]